MHLILRKIPVMIRNLSKKCIIQKFLTNYIPCLLKDLLYFMSFKANFITSFGNHIHPHQHSCYWNLLLTIKVKMSLRKANWQDSKTNAKMAERTLQGKHVVCDIDQWHFRFSYGSEQWRRMMEICDWKNAMHARIKNRKKKSGDYEWVDQNWWK